MDALIALRGKRDTRTYRDEPLEAELLDRLLDSARMAGSAKNRQPVRLVVVTEQADKEKLREAGDYAAWIHTAPVVVVATVAADAGPRRLFDVGRHAQNLMVAAHAEGLATCPVSVHHPEVARAVLGIPTDVEPVVIVTMGWPGAAEAPSPVHGPRLPLEDYAPRGRWPQP